MSFILFAHTSKRTTTRKYSADFRFKFWFETILQFVICLCRPHQCFVCGKTFVMAGDLTSHMRKHTKTEPTIPCTICWKMFERPGQLSEHMRLHTNERYNISRQLFTFCWLIVCLFVRPFECKVCGSRFRTKGYFNIHKTTHWIGRNFACELCGVTFKNPTGVRTHMFKVHGKNAATIRRQKKKDDQ